MRHALKPSSLRLLCLLALGWALPTGCELAAADQQVRVWTTSSDLRLALAESAPLNFQTAAPAPGTRVIIVEPGHTFQAILGLGSSLEHSTCSNLFRVSPTVRDHTIERLVSPTKGIGMNLMRISIGTSDFTGEDWYSYDDLPAGDTDPELKRFSIDRDRAYILPVLKIALEKNPELLFFASPWSPPGWMKTTGNMIGGELKPEYYAAYADYFVRFLQACETEGIPVHAVTVQNEPGVDRANKDPKWYYPSCHWSAEQERDFIRDHLGPAFRRAGLQTQIWCYDHNYNVEPKEDSDGLAHPRTILSDPDAAKFVSGVAFHHYEGQPSGMTQFHNEFPDKPVHFTEGSVFSIYAVHDLIERLRNWATSYNAWVTLLDDHGKPNNGPFPATSAILQLDSATLQMKELLEFNLYGHFMKFIKRGAVRIESTPGDHEFNNIAFRNPDGTLVLVVVNTQDQAKAFSVRLGTHSFSTQLEPESASTFQWRPE